MGVFSARSDPDVFVRVVDDDEKADPDDFVAGNDIDGRSRFLVENLCFDISICLNGERLYAELTTGEVISG